MLHGTFALAAGPTTSILGEYLMTLYVPLADAHEVHDSTANNASG
jgi:hypothetical protein